MAWWDFLGNQTTAGMAQPSTYAPAQSYQPPVQAPAPRPAPMTVQQAPAQGWTPPTLMAVVPPGGDGRNPLLTFAGSGRTITPEMIQNPMFSKQTWHDEFARATPQQMDAAMEQMRAQAQAAGYGGPDGLARGLEMRYGAPRGWGDKSAEGFIAYRNSPEFTPTMWAQGFTKYEDGSIGPNRQRGWDAPYLAPIDMPDWKPLSAQQLGQGYWQYEDGSLGQGPKPVKTKPKNWDGNNWKDMLSQYEEMGQRLRSLGLMQ